MPWWARRQHSALAPDKIYSVYFWLVTFPAAGLFLYDPTSSTLINKMALDDVYNSYTRAVLFCSIALVAHTLGCWTSGSTRIASALQRLDISISRPNNRSWTGVIVTLVVFGSIAWTARVNAAGGMQFLLSNIRDRVDLQSGTAILSSLFECSFLLAIAISSMTIKNHRPALFTVITIFVIFSFMSSVFGGRKPVVLALAISFIFWSFYRGVPKRAWLKIALILMLVPLYSIFILLFRSGDYNSASIIFDHMISDMAKLTTSAISEVSYIHIYAFIFDVFSIDEYWLGASWGDIWLRLMSTDRLYSPPVDEGIYIRSLWQGLPVTPPTPYVYLFPSAWPPETIGVGYANFGLIGLIVLMFFKGYISATFYKSATLDPSRINLVTIYAYMTLMFQFSNLRIVQSLIFITCLYLLSVIMAPWNVSRKLKVVA